MALLPWVWYGGSLARIDLSYFDERTPGLGKILVSNADGIETVLEIAVSEIEPSAGYQFGYLSAPDNWVASIFSIDFSELRLRPKGETFVEFNVGATEASQLYAAGAFTARFEGGLGRLYYRDGSQFSLAGLSSGELLLFPGLTGPQAFGYKFAPDLTHCLRRTAAATIEYRDNTGAVRNLTVSGATLPQFPLNANRYTYVPPYLYAIEDVDFFNPSTQTVTVYRNLVDLDANTVSLDGELQAQCQGIALDPGGNDPTPLAAVFYPP